MHRVAEFSGSVSRLSALTADLLFHPALSDLVVKADTPVACIRAHHIYPDMLLQDIRGLLIQLLLDVDRSYLLRPCLGDYGHPISRKRHSKATLLKRPPINCLTVILLSTSRTDRFFVLKGSFVSLLGFRQNLFNVFFSFQTKPIQFHFFSWRCFNLYIYLKRTSTQFHCKSCLSIYLNFNRIGF